MNFAFAFPMRYLHWWIIATAAMLVLVALGLRMFERRRRQRLDRMIDAHLASSLVTGIDAKARRPLFWLPLLGLFLLSLTLAQPHWGDSWHNVTKQARDVIVCLDTSESMRASTVGGAQQSMPSRLDRAKMKISSLFDMAAGDRFGLVAFSGDAQLISPLTIDHGYFRSVLSSVTTQTLSEEGTDIAEALMEAVRTFQQEDEETNTYGRDHRAILLISDGEEVSGDAIKAAETAADYARVYVIGVGDPEGDAVEVPQWLSRGGAAPYGEKTHVSRLDEETLTKVALSGKGGYIRSTADNTDVSEVFGLMEELASRATSGDLRQRLVNRYQWPLALALCCFIGEGVWLVLLPWMRKRGNARVQADGVEETQHA